MYSNTAGNAIYQAYIYKTLTVSPAPTQTEGSWTCKIK